MTRTDLIAARDAGRFVGSILECGAGMCPWQPGCRKRNLREAWLIGFGMGRVARLRVRSEDWPRIEISLAAFRR